MKHIKLFETFLNENEKFLINLTYEVPQDWFGDPDEVVKTNLFGAKADKKIESYDIKSTKREGGKYVAEIKVISNLSKPDLQKYLDGNSTRIEKFSIS
jgi:hypothetical protein